MQTPDDVDSNPEQHDNIPTTTVDNEDTTETWVAWIKRCTHEAEDQMKALGIEDWITEHRRRKWHWAQKVATEKLNKWTITALLWDPTADPRYTAKRRRGRPVKRWDDDITQHIHNYTLTQQPIGDYNTTQHLQQETPQPPQESISQPTQIPQPPQLPQLPQLPQPSQLPQLPQLPQHDDTTTTTTSDTLHHNQAITNNSMNSDNYFARIHWMRLAADKQLWLTMEKQYLTTEYDS